MELQLVNRRLIGIFAVALFLTGCASAHVEDWFSRNERVREITGYGLTDKGDTLLVEYSVDVLRGTRGGNVVGSDSRIANYNLAALKSRGLRPSASGWENIPDAVSYDGIKYEIIVPWRYSGCSAYFQESIQELSGTESIYVANVSKIDPADPIFRDSKFQVFAFVRDQANGGSKSVIVIPLREAKKAIVIPNLCVVHRNQYQDPHAEPARSAVKPLAVAIDAVTLPVQAPLVILLMMKGFEDVH